MQQTLSSGQESSGQLTFWLPARRVRISASREEELDWMETVARSRCDLLNLFLHYGPSGCCSRTSLACLAPFRTLRQTRFRRRTVWTLGANGQLTTNISLTKEVISDTSWPRFQTSGIQTSPGRCWTLSISDWRNGASVCSLSQVLEAGEVPQRYYLTAKACKGILRRAEKRGKTLPEDLARALRAVAGLEPISSVGGGLIPETAHALNATADTLRSNPGPGSNSLGGVIPILEAGARTGVSTDDPRAGIGIGEPGDPMFSLQRGKQHAIAFDETQITSKTNRCNPQPGNPSHPLSSSARPPAIAQTLTAGMYVGGGATAGENPGVRNVFPMRAGMAVRRLTPMECERLQGFPDGYTDVEHRGKRAADGPRYKALGNSMPVPVIAWIGERIRMVEGMNT